MRMHFASVVAACLISLGMPPALALAGPTPHEAVADEPDVSSSYSVGTIEGVAAVAGVIRAAVVVDQGLTGNRVEEQDVSRRVLIQDAFQNNQGIVSVNQEAGNLNNQANIRVLTLGPAGTALQDIEIAGSVLGTNNTVISSGGERENRIANSFGETAGIVGVNQSAGNLNQQVNLLVLRLGFAPETGLVAMGDASLGDISTNNTLERKGPTGPRAEIITDAFSGFRGIAQVNQSSGDQNIMGNSVALSVRMLALP